MIINIWRPATKSVNSKQVIIRYDICSIDDINNSGSTGLKVIYKCDGLECKFPNKIHSIQRYHLNINRSKNMHEKLQICRSCQTSGSKNPKYGDNRTWEQVMGTERSKSMKSRYKNSFIKNNPSKMERVKNKKGQFIINFENVSKITESFGYKLHKIMGDNKFSKLHLQCNNMHNIIMLYHNFKSGCRCKYCYYDSMRIDPKDIDRFEKYSKVVRYKTRTSFNKYKKIIDPFELKVKNSRNYHIDHIYSIMDGFINNIDPCIIASPINLRVILGSDNLRKGIKSEIELDKLLENYNIFTSFPYQML